MDTLAPNLRSSNITKLIKKSAPNDKTKSILADLLSADLSDLQISVAAVFDGAAPPLADYYDEYADYVFDDE